MLVEEIEDGIPIRPAVVVPVERYSSQRKAEFLCRTPSMMPIIAKREKMSESWTVIQILSSPATLMDRLFPDAFVLFPAAYRIDTGLVRL